MLQQKGIAIIDRSVLGHNLLQSVLKPKGFSCYSLQTIEQLKDFAHKKVALHAVLINANVLENSVGDSLEFFSNSEILKSLPKIFLCRQEDQANRTRLLQVPAATVLDCPFHPDSLYEVLQR